MQSGLVAGAVSSSFSWTAIGDLLPVVRGFFLSSLVTVLASISLATQQGTALYRLSSNVSGMDRLHSSLGYLRSGQWEPRKLQVLIWQMPAGLLTISIVLLGVGLYLQIWIGFAKSGKDVLVRFRLHFAKDFY